MKVLSFRWKGTRVKQKFEWCVRLILDIGFFFIMYIFVRWILAKRNDTWIMNLSNIHKSMCILKIWPSFQNICLIYWEFSLKLQKFWVWGEKGTWVRQKFEWWVRLILDIGFVFIMYIFVRWILAKRNDAWIMNLSNMHNKHVHFENLAEFPKYLLELLRIFP